MTTPDVVSAVVAERPGPLTDVLRLHTATPVDDPSGEGEVLVRMLASTVNPSDAVTVSGAYGSRTVFPFVPGFEGVGVIERIGPGVPRAATGRRVLPLGTAGNWQEIKRTDHSWCIAVPDDLDDETACFAYINPLTALCMVQHYCTRVTKHVLITAATSTIAGHLAELLGFHGIRPVGLIRGTPGHTVANPERWDDVVSTKEPGWVERLRVATGGRGADLVLDCVGGPDGAELFGLLTPGGLFVHYGLLSGKPLPPECFTGQDGKRVEMFRLRETIHNSPRTELPKLFTPVHAHLRAGRLRTPIARCVPLTGLVQSLRDNPAAAQGKVLITYRS